LANSRKQSGRQRSDVLGNKGGKGKKKNMEKGGSSLFIREMYEEGGGEDAANQPSEKNRRNESSKNEDSCLLNQVNREEEKSPKQKSFKQSKIDKNRYKKNGVRRPLGKKQGQLHIHRKLEGGGHKRSGVMGGRYWTGGGEGKKGKEGDDDFHLILTQVGGRDEGGGRIV